jgi:hypothetical protein
VRGWNYLYAAAGEVETAVLAAFDHALELAPHPFGVKVAHLDIDAAIRAGEPLADAVHDRAADDIARGALAARIVVEHKSLALRVGDISAGPTQSFLQDRTGHARAFARKQAGWVELHHFDVT